MESLWLDTSPAIETDPFVPGGAYDTIVVGAGLFTVWREYRRSKVITEII